MLIVTHVPEWLQIICKPQAFGSVHVLKKFVNCDSIHVVRSVFCCYFFSIFFFFVSKKFRNYTATKVLNFSTQCCVNKILVRLLFWILIVRLYSLCLHRKPGTPAISTPHSPDLRVNFVADRSQTCCC